MLTALVIIAAMTFITAWGLKLLWTAEARAASDPFLSRFVQWMFVVFYMVVLTVLGMGLIVL